MKLLTIAQFAEKTATPLQTVYSWIRRGQTKEHGFITHQVGSITLIEETKQPVKVKKSKIAN